MSWHSEKQSSFSRATGNADYVVLAQSAHELMWLRTTMRAVRSDKD